MARLTERRGDAKLTDLLQTLAACAEVWSRRGADFTDRFPAIGEAVALWRQ